ncbi:APC family permease [Psychrobacter aestuarii]|uniref:APC family permease n=1 Tax=Psychrobacter aestuarii TaxID=556327 RepID=A0ABN0VR39_9GAMM|nr:APC family permease [Psychrobacter aestuarii]
MTDITNTRDVISGSTATPYLSAAKKIGLLSMISICIGLVVAQGAMISGLQGIGIGGSAFIAAMVAGLIIAHFNAMSFSELSLMFPEEGTLATYTQKAIGHFPAIISVYAGYILVGILGMTVELFLVDAILEAVFPGLMPPKFLALLILLLLCITNLYGANIFAKVQNLIVVVMVGAILFIGIVAIFDLAPIPEITGPQVSFGMEGVTNGSFISLIALSMWLFVGAEFICPMINEVKNPTKNIPASMHIAVTFIFVMYVIFIVGATHFLSAETLATSDVPYIDYAIAVFGPTGMMVAAVMALAATFSSANTILAALPRMLYGMAEQNQSFPILKKVNRFGAPWVAILLMAFLIMIPFLALSIDYVIVLLIAATLSYLLAYIIAHIDVIVLRRRAPNRARPYKTPFYPIPQILGIIAMIYVIINSSPTPEMASQIFTFFGGILVVIGTIAAIWVKLYMKKGLFEADEIEAN